MTKIKRRHGPILALLAGILLCLPQNTAASTPPHLGYGMMLSYPPEFLRLVKDAGFNWFKYFVYWNDVDGNRDRVYNWDTVDWRLNEACEQGVNVLLRVERYHSDWTPIQDGEMAGWQAFWQDLATHIAQKRNACATPYRVALEVWNEPNLDFQWGGQSVDPARYTQMVIRAYDGARAGDPHILVIAGSLAPTGGTGDGRAMNDVDFLDAMYDAGLQDHFDAISTHNYGFGGEPEDKTWGSGILNFRRAEDLHAVMVAHGDGDLPVWGTEFGWLLESAECSSYWDQIGFAWQQVSAQQQADYLTRAFAYADANWPWMQTMIVSNLDFSVLPWYGTCDPLRYFAIVNPDWSPRPAYTALDGMAKNPRSWSVFGMAASPDALASMQLVSDPHVVMREVTVLNTGEGDFGWTAETTASELGLSLSPTHGDAGGSTAVTVDPRGLGLGTYTGTITFTADTSEIPESPIAVPVHVHIVDSIWRTHLPLVQRN